jgi:hypothetical protein
MLALIDNLARAGTSPAILDTPEGGQLCVVPEYGRVLGLSTGDSHENFFWTHPALATAASTTAYVHRDGWRNLGGDRTWLAPEIALFIDDLARPEETYAVPAALDPGQWRRKEGAHGLQLRNASVARLKRSARTVRFIVTKQIQPAANPLRGLIPGVSYAGYAQTTVLDIEVDRDDEPPVQLGIWNLLQLPTPGRMIVPTYHRAVPQTVFGTVRPADLACGNHALVWRMPDTGGNAKLSLKAAVLTGRAGYLSRARGGAGFWNLVVRAFVVNPSENYVDALWENPADTGYACQACAVNEGADTFNELEYHAPAAASTVGRNRTCDQSQLWAFRGDFEEIAAVMHVLLGIDDITHVTTEGDR